MMGRSKACCKAYKVEHEPLPGFRCVQAMDKEVLREIRKMVRKLHQAIAAENVEEIKELVGLTADIDYKYNGKTASEIAFKTGNVLVMTEVFRAGCDLNRVIDEDGNTFLIKAIYDCSGDDALVVLLENGADPDLPNNADSTPLHIAASLGRSSAVELLLKRSKFINRCDLTGQTALFKCSCNGHIEIVKLLIEAGSDMEWPDNERRTPLFVAIEAGHLEIVKLLVEAGCNVNARDRYGRTPLMFSVKYGFLDVARYLIQNGSDIEKCDSNGLTPFSEACANSNLDMVKELIKNGCDINSKNFDLKQTALHKSICQASSIFGKRNKQLELFRILMDAGCSVDIPDQLGCTPIFYAALKGESDMANTLMKAGASILHKTNNRETLLHASVLGHQIELTETFFRAGVEINSVNSKNETPLYLAIAHSSKIELIQKLIECGSDLDICENSNFQTPLHIGVLNGYKEAVDLLAKSGANVNFMSKRGYTPLYAACDKKDEEMVKVLLRSKEIDVDLGVMHSPIHAAIKHGCLGIVNLLIKLKCDVNKLTDTCQSPLYLASELNFLNIAVELVKSGANPQIHLKLRKQGKCCLQYQDPHPHLELDPLFGAIENNNLRMAQLLLISADRINHDALTTLKDIVFRTGYAKDARLSQTTLRKYAYFFAHSLCTPRSLKEMARAIIRKRLGVYPEDKIVALKLPDSLRDYVLFAGLETICS